MTHHKSFCAARAQALAAQFLFYPKFYTYCKKVYLLLGTPGAPGTAGILGAPGVPGAAGAPSAPGIPGALGAPGTPATPAAVGSSAPHSGHT